MKTTILILFTFIILVLSPLIGVSIQNNKKQITISHFSDYNNEIIKKLRLPQTLMAFLVGVGLSLCGLIYQTLFKNDLASPFTLGISSGSALGAALAIKFNIIFTFFIFNSISLVAFSTGLITVFMIFIAANIKKNIDNFTMLLFGVAINIFTSSIILLVSYLSDFNQSFKFQRWLMGTIYIIGYEKLLLLLILLIVFFIISFYFREDLNMLSLDTDIAVSRGINIYKLKIILLIVSSILIAYIVSICGPIGFVGIICPHIVKLIFGDDHKKTILTSSLFGGLFLVVCFTISRTILYPFLIPVGVITSFLGGPFLMYLLFKKRNNI